MIALAVLALLAQETVSAGTPAAIKAEPKISVLAAKCSPEAPCRGVWNGLHYVIVAPDTATFKAAEDSSTSWSFSCRRDAMDDRRTCSLIGKHSGPGIFMVWTSYSPTPSISVFHPASEAYPRTSESIRIDRNEALSAPEDEFFRGAQAQRLIAQMKAGGEVKVRYYDWPYEYAQDGTLDLKGFSKIFAAVTEMRAASR